MVIVRLSRAGAKKNAFYHIVVAHKEDPRDGRFIEKIGTYDPRKPMADARVDRARLEHWFGLGAKASPTLAKVLREHKKALDALEVAAGA